MSDKRARIIVQKIQTIWTKKSRGAPGAVLRNAVPVALPLPVDRVSDNSVLFEHCVSFREFDHFSSPSEVVASLESSRSAVYGCVRLELGADGLSVIWAYTDSCGGAPLQDS